MLSLALLRRVRAERCGGQHHISRLGCPAPSVPPSSPLQQEHLTIMPDSAVPVVRRPVRRVPSSASKDLPELRRLSVGELVSSSSSRGSSAEKEGGAAVAPRVLLRRPVKVKTKKEETALQRIMRDDDLPPPFSVAPLGFPVLSPADPPPSSSSPATQASPAAPAKSRRRVAKTCVSLFSLSQFLIAILPTGSAMFGEESEVL